MQKMLLILTAAVVLGLVARLVIGYFSASRVATGLSTSDTNVASLTGCEDLHNCTASTATNNRNRVEAFTYKVSPDEAINAFSHIIKSQPGAQIITQTANYLHATYRTKLLGYTDDLELLLDETTGTLHVRSASRLGKSDLGANRKRIEALRILAKNS